VEIKAIAREAGYRSKVAVAARQTGIDPVGCCVGLRGIRIQNIVSELNGEKIDVIMWDPDVPAFITNALSPAPILSVKLDEEEGIATVVVPDKQLSLAIGKEGQNARLAAKLTGWRIDIKSASVAEAEKAAEAKPPAKARAKKAVPAEEATTEEPLAEAPPAPEEISEPAVEPTEEAAEPAPAPKEEEAAEALVFFEPQLAEDKPQLRFAEDTALHRTAKPETKDKKKKKKKGIQAKETAEDGIRLKKRRRTGVTVEEDEDYY
jgi:N utilization substance protein A